MKPFRVWIAAFAAFAVALALAQPAAAEAAPAAEADNTDYSFGTVVNIGPDTITVSEYDYESDKETEVAYKIAEDAEFTNAQSLKDIVKGDSVDITFVEENGQKTAVAVLVEKLAEIQDEDEEQIYDE